MHKAIAAAKTVGSVGSEGAQTHFRSTVPPPIWVFLKAKKRDRSSQECKVLLERSSLNGVTIFEVFEKHPYGTVGMKKACMALRILYLHTLGFWYTRPCRIFRINIRISIKAAGKPDQQRVVLCIFRTAIPQPDVPVEEEKREMCFTELLSFP